MVGASPSKRRMVVPAGTFLVTSVSCTLPRATPMTNFPMSAGDLTSASFGAMKRDDVGAIGLAELHRLRALRQHRHRREQNVDASRGQRRDAIGHGELREFDLHAELLCKQRGDVGIEAVLLAGRS